MQARGPGADLEGAQLLLPRPAHMISVLYCAHLCMKYSFGISNFLEVISSVSHYIVSSVSLY